LIANNVIENADVKFVAIAPDGKEVEELTGKEILIALRRKVKVDEYLRYNSNGSNGHSRGGSRGSRFEKRESVAHKETVELKFSGDVKEKLRAVYSDKLGGQKGALLLDEELDVIKKVGSREVARNVKGSNKSIGAIVLEGNASGSMIRLCDENGIPYLAATNFSSHDGSAKVSLVSL
jgi:DNA primase